MSTSLRAPVLMLHGMCCTGDVWKHFRGFFETRGARVYTPTLRPDQRTRARPPRELRQLGFEDYVGDVVDVRSQRAHRVDAQPQQV